MWEQWARKEKWEGGLGHRRNSVDLFLYINMHTPPLSHIRTQEEWDDEEREEKKETDFYMFIDYTAQFAKRARCVYADLFCSQYIESVVSPIFCRQQQRERRKDYTRHHQAIKRKSNREKTDDYCHKFCLHSSILMFLYLLMRQIVCFLL